MYERASSPSTRDALSSAATLRTQRAQYVPPYDTIHSPFSPHIGQGASETIEGIGQRHGDLLETYSSGGADLSSAMLTAAFGVLHIGAESSELLTPRYVARCWPTPTTSRSADRPNHAAPATGRRW